jgi:hypothetical protein
LRGEVLRSDHIGSLIPRLGALVAAALLCAACSTEGTARFEASLTDGGCYGEQFPFEPDFFAVVATSSGALMRMEEHVRERTRTDGFYMVIDPDRGGKPGIDGQPLVCPSMDDVRGGGAFTVEPEGCMQAYFRFNYSCQRDFLNLQVRGEVNFERFTLTKGEEMRGTLSGDLVELRTSPSVEGKRLEILPRGTLTATFAFTVDESPNRQLYYWPPVHIDQP